MINNLFNFVKIKYLTRIKIKYFKKHKYIERYDYNFRNIEFLNKDYLIKIFLSNKYFLEKNNSESSYEYHSFDWLNVAKNMGGVENVKRSKKHIINWIDKGYSKKNEIWNSNFVAKRFINLVYNYDFFAISASPNQKLIINELIYEHFIIMEYLFKNKISSDMNIEIAKCIFLGSLIFKKASEEQSKKILDLIFHQLDLNGFHKSYNPSAQFDFINHLLEIKNMMLFFNTEGSKEINFSILKAFSLLLSLFHKDGSLALFNGSNNFYYADVKKLIQQATDIREREILKIDNGILIYGDKIKKIFMDVVLPTSENVNSNLHSGTLSFEFSSLNEKIITNCGSLEKRIGKKPEYLRYSAAHSTIVLNNTNISELVKKKSYKRIPKNIKINQTDLGNSILWEASHDGYLNNYKKIIKRRILIFKNENKIQGEDSIITSKINSNTINYSIRFHLSPECNCLLTNDKKSVLIKTNNNVRWVFKSDSSLIVENSIYIHNGKSIKENKQIVIYGNSSNKKNIKKWSLTRS